MSADKDKEPQNKRGRPRSFLHILVGLFVLYALLFFYGASVRGITKRVEVGSLRAQRIPSQWTFTLAFFLNTVLFGLPGFLYNFMLDDPFDHRAVVRVTNVLTGAHTAHHTEYL